MTNNITRRDWLRGTTTIAGGLLFANSALSQSMTVEGFVPTKENPIRYSSNENPYGINNVARKAILEALDVTHLYTGSGRRELISLISQIEGVPTKNIIMSAGSGELLKVMGLISSLEGGSVLAANPTYHSLVRYSEAMGTTIKWVPVDDNMTIDLDAMRAAYTDDVKIIYLTNPNNPLPTIMQKDKLRQFCIDMSKKCYVFIDEAYKEYVDNPDFETMVPLTAEYDNIIVTRTASKIHGLAGARIGFGFASERILAKMNQFMTGAVNTLGVHAALASYKDTEYQDFVRRKNKESLEILYALFDKHNVRYVKSNTNFTFFETGIEIAEVQKRFLNHGVQIARGFPPFTKWCRVSTAKPEDMQYFAEVYEKEFT